MFSVLYAHLDFAYTQSTPLFSCTPAHLDKNTRGGGITFMKHFRFRRGTAPCPLESTLIKNSTLTRLQSTLTKTLDLKSFRINTYKKAGGEGYRSRRGAQDAGDEMNQAEFVVPAPPFSRDRRERMRWNRSRRGNRPRKQRRVRSRRSAAAAIDGWTSRYLSLHAR